MDLKDKVKFFGMTNGLILFILGIVLFGGSFVLDIDGLRTAGIGLGVVGVVLLCVAALRKDEAEKEKK